MSAPLKVNSDQLRSVATFLDLLSEATNATGVRAGAYGPLLVDIDGAQFDIRWADEIESYVIDDRIGS